MARTRTKAEIEAARAEAESAWADLHAAQAAEDEKTARLRAQRLAREAAPATPDGAAAPTATKRRRPTATIPTAARPAAR